MSCVITIRLRVSENQVPRKIFGSKKDEVTGDWRRLHNEELHDLHCSLHTIRVNRPRRMRWRGMLCCVGEICFGVLMGIPVKDGEIILKWTFKK